MNRLQKLLPNPHQIIPKEKTKKTLSPVNCILPSYSKCFSSNNGLLEMMQPLITHITNLRLMQDPGLSYKEVVKEYITNFIKNAPIAVAFLDLDLRIVTYSSKWTLWFKENLTAKSNSTQLEGKNIIDLLSPCPKLIKKILNNNLKGISEFRDVLEYKIKNRTRAVRWESFPWRDHEQRPLGVVVFCEDITKRQQLTLRAKKLEQSNQLLENFALIFSHDLIQPIRQISNFIGILGEQFKEANIKNTQIEHTFSIINKSLSQINTLSEGIILYCRKGELAISLEPVSLLQTINEISSSCLMSNQLSLNLLFDDTIYLKANRTCMLQLFQNLLTNAVKHSSTENPLITICSEKLNNNFYRITIHNKGACSSRYIKKNIFEPFCSSNKDGSGLGLMICKKIVTSFGGTIDINSTKKHGTTVTLTLPAAD